MKRFLAATAIAALAATGAAAQDEGVAITMNAVQIFGTIDPAKINDYTEYMAATNLYDGLTTVETGGEIAPQLAESWEVSEDSLTYTFHLKADATFQDGSPVEASDIVYSMRRLLAINEGPAYLFADLVEPGNVKALDARTVEFTLNRVYAPFLTITPLVLAVDEDRVEATEDDPWGEQQLAETVLGAGPYTLESWERGARMVLSRYDGYHGGFATHAEGARPIDEVTWVITRDEATVRSLAQRGDLAMSSQYQANATYENIGNLDAYEVLEAATATGFYLKLNNQVAPTDDVHVRRAIALAVDYETIREAIYPGAVMRGPIADAFADAVPGEAEGPVQDLVAAKAELAKSKYAGDGPIPLEHVYVANTSFEEEIGLLLKATLDQIGFDVTLRPEPWNRMTELATQVETTPATAQVFYGPTYPSPDSVYYVQFHSKAAGTWASMEWVEDPELDAMIDAARAEVDTDARNAIYRDMFTKMVDEQRSIWMLTQTQRHAISSCLEGFDWVPMQSWYFDFSRFGWSCG